MIHIPSVKGVSIGMMLAVALVCAPGVRAAASPQVCTVSTACSVGEFLFDDDYTPITSGTCTFTSKNPDGTSYISSTPLTSTADGYYAHEFTTPTVTGVYRSQICCTVGSDYMCIDKSFEARASASGLTQNEVSDAVWNASRTSYTTSGTFGVALQNITPAASDIASAVWNYSGRTVTSFGSVITDIWAYSTRTLTGASLTSGSIATKSDVDSIQSTTSTTIEVKEIKEQTKQTQLLLEKQINKPVFENSIEEFIDAQSKLKTTQKKAQNLYFQSAQTRAALVKLQKNWARLDREQKLEAINSIATFVGEPADGSKHDTLYGNAQWFIGEWDFDMSKTAVKNIASMYQYLHATQKQLVSTNPTIVYFPQRALNAQVLLSLNIGEVGDDGDSSTLFGEIHDRAQFIAELQTRDATIQATLGAWKKTARPAKEATLTELTRDINILNRIPQVHVQLPPKISKITDKSLHNQALFLNGLVTANLAYLTNKPEKSFSSSWMELGSIVFKTLVTNPSELITQDAEVKYYLPKEIKKQHVLESDEGLTLKYDTDKGQFYVSGTYSLEPGESKIVSVRVEDIWVITDKELDSIQKQATALIEPLKKTSYYAQGVTLESDIQVSLDKIRSRQGLAETPDSKLAAYADSQADLEGIQRKLDSLKTIVAEAGSTGTLFGFVGATQTLAVWGLIIVISTGFIFLTIYMRNLSGSVKPPVQEKPEPKKTPKAKKPVAVVASTVVASEKPAHDGIAKSSPQLLMVAVMIAYGAAVASASSFVTYNVVDKNASQAKVLGTSSSKAPQTCPVDVQKPLTSEEQSAIPTPSDAPLAVVSPTPPLVYATVTETPTGWLRVRTSPSGSEVSKVDVGKTFPVLETAGAWMKIRIDDVTEGWVSAKYITTASKN